MKLTIIIADDEVPLRTMLRTLLERDGRFEIVAEAGHGQQALDLVDRHDPDLLLLDLGMPVLDGLQVLERLGASRRPRVVVLTGFDDADIEKTARDLGASDVLVKGSVVHEITDVLAG